MLRIARCGIDLGQENLAANQGVLDVATETYDTYGITHLSRRGWQAGLEAA